MAETDPRPVDRLLIGLSGPALTAAAKALRGSAKDVVVITDDRDEVAGLGGRITAIELEELLPSGVAHIEQAWDRGVFAWLKSLYPGRLSGIDLPELLSVNLLLQPELRFRIDAVALQDELFRRFTPGGIEFIGRPPVLCATIPTEARRRGIPVQGDGAAGTISAERLRDGLLALPLLVRHAARAVARVAERRRTALRLQTVALSPGDEEPRLWVVLSPMWRQNCRHIIESLLPALEREGVPYGIAFSMTFGEPLSTAEAADGSVDELSLFDGTLGRFRPAALDQVTGTVEWAGLARLLARWAPRAIRGCLTGLRGAGQLRVGEQVGSLLSDAPALLRIATNELLRILDAEQATKHFLLAHPSAKTVVFASASNGETKMADCLMQEAGIVTVDFAHGEVNASNLRTQWRSRSVYHASWTVNESTRFAHLGTNRHCVGGFMPRLAVSKRVTQNPPVILVATNYVCDFFRLDGRITTLKFARRLAAALVQLVEHLGDRAQVILRPHPYEDRKTWVEMLGPRHAPQLSDIPALRDDLARASIVVTTLGGAAIEALAASVPVLFHSGPAVEPASLFGLVSAKRRFSTGSELIEKVDELLSKPMDLAPEHQLLTACFGSSQRPRAFIDLLREIDPTLFRNPARSGSVVDGVAVR
jgi:hypothetical protein